MSRLFPLGLALLVATSAAAEEQQKVSNFIPFDLAVCFLEPATVEQPVTDTALSASWNAWPTPGSTFRGSQPPSR